MSYRGVAMGCDPNSPPAWRAPIHSVERPMIKLSLSRLCISRGGSSLNRSGFRAFHSRTMTYARRAGLRTTKPSHLQSPTFHVPRPTSHVPRPAFHVSRPTSPHRTSHLPVRAQTQPHMTDAVMDSAPLLLCLRDQLLCLRDQLEILQEQILVRY